nr:ATP-binding cassette domain-containing protein [Actinopolyspora mortivallis]
MTAASMHGVNKKYGNVLALDDVSLEFEENRSHGLLGRNGAGKTTIMRILTCQEFESSGRVEVFGRPPYENAQVLDKVCFVRKSRKYPDMFAVHHALTAAGLLYANWTPSSPRTSSRTSNSPGDSGSGNCPADSSPRWA